MDVNTDLIRDTPDKKQTLHNKLTGLLTNLIQPIPIINTLINRGNHMFMVQLMVSNILDEHFDYGFKNVPRIFKKRVKEQLIVLGMGHLADDNVTNYVGPRPKITLEDMLKQAEEEWERKQKEKEKENQENGN